MQLQFQTKSDGLWAKVSGEIDMAVADDFKEQLQTAIKKSGSRNLVLDFSEVSFIDSSGLGVVLGRYRQLVPFGGTVAITGANEHMYQVLILAGLHRVIQVDKPKSLWSKREGRI